LGWVPTKWEKGERKAHAYIWQAMTKKGEGMQGKEVAGSPWKRGGGKRDTRKATEKMTEQGSWLASYREVLGVRETYGHI
jgi:hypothetical protein